jgi:predicted aminopeptidase
MGGVMNRHFYLPFPLAILLVVGGAALCSGCYTLKQGTTMLGYLNRAVPLEGLVNADSEEDRRFALQVMDIRRFAMEELGLRQSKNYTRYVQLDRNYLAAVVSACAKDSFTRHEWWFPIVGRVPYKGFFDIEDARKERKKLEKKDLDVWIRGVDAFSTLGWFQDPLYSFMKDYPLRDLADLIIHELFHATVFLRNHVQFNEELAQFVGSEGARLYMESIAYNVSENTSDNAETDAIARRADQAAYLAFIRSLIAELDTVYKNAALSREEKLEQKGLLIAQAKINFEANYDSVFMTENYRGFIDLPINNAYLELFLLYYEGNTYFKDLYERSGSDLRTFIEAAKTLKGKEDPRIEFERALGV